MDVASLRSPLVHRTIETINEGRLDEFLALFGRGPSEKRLGCRCTLTWYKKRIMYGHKTFWDLWADLWNGDLTLAEKTLTPLTDAHMIEVERALCTSKGFHRAGGWDVVPEHLAKLLRHHRLRCCDADWIDVRGDFLDCGVSGASVAGE